MTTKSAVSAATTSIEIIDRDEAKALRKNALGEQRGLNKNKVRYYQSLMRAGKWCPNIGAPVAIMKDGATKDGNHRLEAVATSDPKDAFKIPMLVSRGLDNETIPFMDIGTTRSLAHMLQFAGSKVSNPNATATLAKVLLNYEPPGLPFAPNKSVDMEEALGLVAANEDKFDRITSAAMKISNRDNYDPITKKALGGSSFSPRVVGWFLWQMEEKDGVGAFLMDHAERKYTDPEDPSYAYLQHFAKDKFEFTKGAESQRQVIARMAAISGLYFAHVDAEKWKPWDGAWKKFPYPSPNGLMKAPLKKVVIKKK